MHRNGALTAVAPDAGDLTAILATVRGGDRRAFDVVFERLYDELHTLARRQLASHDAGETLRTTVLVHEAYLKLVDGARLADLDRRHFFALAARVMRQIIIDHARQTHALKRGGGAVRVALEAVSAPTGGELDAAELIALDRALTERVDDRRAAGGRRGAATAPRAGLAARAAADRCGAALRVRSLSLPTGRGRKPRTSRNRRAVKMWSYLTASLPVVLLILAPGCVGSGARTAADQPMSDAWRAAVADTIMTVLALSQAAYESDDCEGGDDSWMPDDGYVHFVALDMVIRLEEPDEILALCQRLRRDRVSQREEIDEQTVHLLTPDAAYVVTRSVGTTQWRDGRTQVLPTVETAVMARQGGRWRVVYKHISWRESPPARE
jgi:RNA polymerase sigma factor (TIGR02999 family)